MNLKCLFKEHKINDITKQQVRERCFVIAYCINCGQRLLISHHEVRPNSFYIDEV